MSTSSRFSPSTGLFTASSDNTGRVLSNEFLSPLYISSLHITPTKANTIVLISDIAGSMTISIGVGAANMPPFVGDTMVFILKAATDQIISFPSGDFPLLSGVAAALYLIFNGSEWLETGRTSSSGGSETLDQVLENGSSILEDRHIDINGHELTITNGADTRISITPVSTELRSINHTGADNYGSLGINVSDSDASFVTDAVFNDSVSARISGVANNSGSQINYQADTHQFTGETKLASQLRMLYNNIIFDTNESGFDMKDSNGVAWQVRIGTDGALMTTQI